MVARSLGGKFVGKEMMKIEDRVRGYKVIQDA